MQEKDKQVRKVLEDLYIKGNHEGFDRRNWGRLSQKCREAVDQALSALSKLGVGVNKELLDKLKDAYGYLLKGSKWDIADAKRILQQIISHVEQAQGEEL